MIQSISDHQTSIAGAVEEQTATTTEMSRSVVDAARGSGRIAETITVFAAVAESTAQAGAEALSSAEELKAMSERFAQLMTGFRF